MNRLLKWIAYFVFREYLVRERQVTIEQLKGGRTYFLRCIACGDEVEDDHEGGLFCPCDEWHVSRDMATMPVFWLYDFGEAEAYEKSMAELDALIPVGENLPFWP